MNKLMLCTCGAAIFLTSSRAQAQLTVRAVQPTRAAVGTSVVLLLDRGGANLVDEVVFVGRAARCTESPCPPIKTIVIDSSRFSRWWTSPAACPSIGPPSSKPQCYDHIAVTIPAGVGSGRISVRHTSIPLETSTSDDILAVVAPPVITATVPTVISSSADTVWIRGGGFTGAIVEGAAKFNVVSDSLIWTLLNQGACSGRIDVTNAGVALSSDTIHTTMRVTSISPAHVKTGIATAANVWATKLFGSCLSVDEVVFAGLGKDIVLPQSNDNMYLAPSGEWIALKKVPAGAVSGPVKVRRNGRNKLEAISSDTLFIDDVPPPPRSPVDCESSCFEARVTGAQNTLLNGSAAVEVDAGSGAAGDFNIVLRKRDDGGNYISFMRTTNGGRPRAGVTYALANSCDEEAAENNKPDQFTAEYWVNAFHEGPGVRYASKAGTFTINEITKDHIIGQFAFTACHFKDDGTREQIHARGNFNALWPH